MFRQVGSVVAAMSLRMLRLSLVAVATLSLVVVATGAMAMAETQDSEELSPRDPFLTPHDPADLGKPPVLFAAELEQPDTLGVGRVARNVSTHLPALDAMASWLDDRIHVLGFQRARPVVARDNAEMAEFLRRGIVDVVSETPLSAIHFAKTAGATILLREIRSGHATYDSVVFTRKDSTVRSLEDLRSRRIAFEDPGSTTAFLLPLASIKRAGLPAVALANAMQDVPGDAVGYFFALSEKAIIAAVTRNVADAGALSSEDWTALAARHPESFAGLRLIYESDKLPRAFVLTGPAITSEQRLGLRKLLLSMSDDADGEEALERYNKVDQFRAVDAEAERSLADLEESYLLVEQEMTAR